MRVQLCKYVIMIFLKLKLEKRIILKETDFDR